MNFELYQAQQPVWPVTGRHILAHFDDREIVVYQAYRPEIGRYAVDHQRFGGAFSFNRMSWIKPNFLWMMYRSGWGTKPDQEVILAIHLRREAFDKILAAAVHSSFAPEIYQSMDDWKSAVTSSDVRLQWDPDHDPHGRPLERRAIQLGLRGSALRKYGTEWITRIEDLSDFVREQSAHLTTDHLQLVTPRECVYPISNIQTARKLGIAPA